MKALLLRLCWKSHFSLVDKLGSTQYSGQSICHRALSSAVRRKGFFSQEGRYPALVGYSVSGWWTQSPSDTFNPEGRDAPLFLFMKLLSHQLSAAGIPLCHPHIFLSPNGMDSLILIYTSNLKDIHEWDALFNRCVGFVWEGDLGAGREPQAFGF